MSTEVTDPYSSLRKALEKATPGPWKLYAGSRSIVAERSHLRADISVATASWGNRYCPEKFSAEANGAYIAAANPSEISKLLADRDRLVEALREIRAFTHSGIVQDMASKALSAPTLSDEGVGK